MVEPVYYHCLLCDLIFIDDKYILDSHSELQRYKLHNNSIEDEGYVNYFKKFIKTAGIDKLTKVNGALDFGCGPEPVLQILLQRMGIKTDIYDPYFYPDNNFLSKKYDLITCTEVLEHLTHPHKEIKLLASLLRKNGLLAVSTLFHTARKGDFKNWWYRQDPTHICFYSPVTFKWLERHLYFKIKVIDNHNVCVLEKQSE